MGRHFRHGEPITPPLNERQIRDRHRIARVDTFKAERTGRELVRTLIAGDGQRFDICLDVGQAQALARALNRQATAVLEELEADRG